MNYYTVLGLDPSATDADVKKAYRKLASKHHPDKGGDPEQFKQVQEAYEKITNGEGDRPQWQSFTGWEDFSQEKQYTYNKQGYYGAQKNPDKLVKVEISLRDAIKGTDVLIESEGIREVVPIPAGSVTDGHRLRLKGKGHSRFKHVPPGDLIIILHVICPPGVTVKGNDIYQRIDVNVLDAITGSSQILEHISGKQLNIKIPPGTQNGAKLRLKGWGIKSSKFSGDLYVLIQLYTPQLTPEQIAIIKTINGTNDE